jgi:hypothetical protein
MPTFFGTAHAGNPCDGLLLCSIGNRRRQHFSVRRKAPESTCNGRRLTGTPKSGYSLQQLNSGARLTFPS